MSPPARALRKSLIPAARNLARSRFVAPASSSNFYYRTMATAPKKEFLCIIPDKPDTLAKRLEVRPTHLADIKPLVAAGKVAAGGAMFEEAHPSEGKPPAFKGSMVIYTVQDADEARELMRNDIYTKSGVWDVEKAQVIPYVSAVREPLS